MRMSAALFFVPFLILSLPSLGVSILRADEKAESDLAKKVINLVDADEERLVKVFKNVHANPEPGFQETKTAALVAKEWKELGYARRSPASAKRAWSEF